MTFLLKITKNSCDTHIFSSYLRLFAIFYILLWQFSVVYADNSRFGTVFESKTAHAEPRSLSLVSIAKAGNGWEHGKGHRKAFTKRSVHGRIEHLANRR